MISFAFNVCLGTKLMSQGVNAANARLVFGLAGGKLTGGVLHMEDAGGRMGDDGGVLHMGDAGSRMEDDGGVFPRMEDEDKPWHMEDAASRMEDDLICVRMACRVFRKEDETNDCGRGCLDSRCREDNKGEDPL